MFLHLTHYHCEFLLVTSRSTRVVIAAYEHTAMLKNASGLISLHRLLEGIYGNVFNMLLTLHFYQYNFVFVKKLEPVISFVPSVRYQVFP